MKLPFIVLSLIILFNIPVSTQNLGLEVITSQNIDRLERVGVFGRGTIAALDWSPDGNQIAVGGSAGVWIYNAHDLAEEPLWLEDHTGYATDVIFHPDGNLLFTSSATGHLRLFDTPSYELIGDYCFEDPIYEGCLETAGLDISQSGDMLAIASSDRIILWDVDTQTEHFRLADNSEYVKFALNDSVLVSSSRGWTQTLHFWDLNNLSSTEINENPASLTIDLPFSIWDLEVSPDRTQAIIAGFGIYDTGVATVDVASQTVVNSFLGAGNTVTFVSEERIAAASFPLYSINFIDTSTFESEYRLVTGTVEAEDLAPSPDGSRLAIGNLTGELLIYDPQSGRIQRSNSAQGYYHWDIAFNDDSSEVVILSGNGVMAPTLAGGGAGGAEFLHVWRWQDKTFRTFRPPEDQSLQISAIVSTPGNDFWISNYDGSSSIFSWSEDSNFTPLINLRFEYNRIFSLEWSEQTQTLVFLFEGTERGIGVIDTTAHDNQPVLYGLNDRPSFRYYDVAIDSSGTHIAATTSTGQVIIWEIGTDTPIYSEILNSTVISIAFVDDSSLLAVYSTDSRTGKITFIDLETYTQSLEVQIPDEILGVENLTFNLTYDLLITSGINGELVVWTLGETVEPIVFNAHNTNINSIDMNRDGTLIVTSSRDGTVQLWGVPSQ